MYTLDPKQFSQYDLTKTREFVNFWEKYYKYKIKTFDETEEIDYIVELNVNQNLTEENIRRLLRWKDPTRLTHVKKSDPNKNLENPKVMKVLSNIDAINNFRADKITEDEFLLIANDIFPQGPIYRIFLLHICKPHKYPIADQHVFRAYSYQKGCSLEESWEKYLSYKSYFFEIADACKIKKHEESKEYVAELKRIDNALMSFGQFLKKYR